MIIILIIMILIIMIITIIMIIIIIIIVMNITDRESRARADVTRPIAARKGGEQGGTSNPPGFGAYKLRTIRKGTNGVSTNGVTANFMFFDRGTFRVLPVTYFLYFQKCQGVPFSPTRRNSLLLQRPHRCL